MSLRRLLLALASCFACTAPAAAAPARPNVIVILCDDVGYGDLACHGNPVVRTPHIDRLHAESARFTDFHSAPYCTPTRSQLMTGRDALANGATRVVGGRSFIRPEIPTMAELFAAAGYGTGMFGKWHLGDNAPHRPHDRGFAVAKYHLGWGYTAAQELMNGYYDSVYRDNGVPRRFEGFCTDFWFDSAMAWMKEQHAQQKPFLCYLPLNAAHGPFWAPKEAAAPYAAQEGLAGFYGLIANIDDNLGRLEAMLRATGLRDNTVLVFLTDNGTAAGERVFNAGMRGKKGDVYDGGHRVPSFVRWPGGNLKTGADLAPLAQMQDILPTLLELCAIAPRAGTAFDGRSLAPLLRTGGGAAWPERTLVVQLHLEEGRAVVLRDRWRLVAGTELYDLRVDPTQARNVAAQHPRVVEELSAHYRQWWRERVPAIRDLVPIALGSPQENPVQLASADWQDIDDPFSGGPQAVRLAPSALRGGPWNVEVARAGDYEIALYRWPPEAKVALTAPLPELGPTPKAVGRSTPAGRALPIVAAKLVAAGQQLERKAAEGAEAVTFRVQLPAGRTQLHGWFADAQGRDVCGAYYAVVTADK